MYANTAQSELEQSELKWVFLFWEQDRENPREHRAIESKNTFNTA
jgi:hypothetical protein